MDLLHGDAFPRRFWTEKLWRRIFMELEKAPLSSSQTWPTSLWPLPSALCVFGLLSDAAITPHEEWPVPAFLIRPAGNIFSASISTVLPQPLRLPLVCFIETLFFSPTSSATPLCLGQWRFPGSMFTSSAGISAFYSQSPLLPHGSCDSPY